MPVAVRFLGSGDAFGSGGRMNTCILVQASRGRFLIDCGASALISMRRFAVEPNTIDFILISHLHGDHFGGLPFFVLDAQLVSRRTAPLLIAGPPGTPARLEQAMEALFPGSASASRPFALEVVELEPNSSQEIADVTVTSAVVEHPAGAPALALRVRCDDRVIAYTGDTRWTDALIPISRGADLLIAESYTFDRPVGFHLSYQTLLAQLEALAPKRLVLTHMGPETLGRLDELDCEHADDGMTIALP